MLAVLQHRWAWHSGGGLCGACSQTQGTGKARRLALPCVSARIRTACKLLLIPLCTALTSACWLGLWPTHASPTPWVSHVCARHWACVAQSRHCQLRPVCFEFTPAVVARLLAPFGPDLHGQRMLHPDWPYCCFAAFRVLCVLFVELSSLCRGPVLRLRARLEGPGMSSLYALLACVLCIVEWLCKAMRCPWERVR